MTVGSDSPLADSTDDRSATCAEDLQGELEVEPKFDEPAGENSGAHGSEFVAAMLTVHAALRQQHRDILSFVATACHARLLGLAPPTLLPTAPVPSTHRRPAAQAA